MDQKFIWGRKLHHHPFSRIFLLFYGYEFLNNFFWGEGVNKYKTHKNFLSELLLNGANNAYLELPETEALPPSCHTSVFILTPPHV